MDRVIDNFPRNTGYKMGNTCFKVVCYADDAALIAESEDELQRLLHAFDQKAIRDNMEIKAEKTKCMAIAKEPIRCKVNLKGIVLEQVMTFSYLGSEITSNGNR